MEVKQKRLQSGMMLILVLVFLGVSTLVIVPTLTYAATALHLLQTSRTSVQVQYALNAITQQSLWMLQYETFFQDCDSPTDGIVDSFADCVVKRGSWTLATPDNLAGVFNETQVEKVNGQEVSVKVEVPGGPTAPPPDLPTPISGPCLFSWITRDVTWIQTGKPITYMAHVYNCSGNFNINLQRAVVVLPSSFDYVTASGGGSLPPSGEPGTNVLCTDIDAPYVGCQLNSRLLAWPVGDGVWGGSTVRLLRGATKELTFQAVPSKWGLFYTEFKACAFASNTAGCNTEISEQPRSQKAPVVVGMFNIKGRGPGYSFQGTSALDSSGSSLISQQPQ